MRIARISFVSLVVLGSLSSIGDREMTRAKADLPNHGVYQAIPVPVFIAFVPVGSRLLIREGDTMIVGEMRSNCPAGFDPSPAFSADPSFVTLIDDSCLCPTSGSKIRFLVQIAPQRGDAGKYSVVIRGSACGVHSNEATSFNIKVKPAP